MMISNSMSVKKKIGVPTSSRADYGIYSPLLKKISTDQRFELTIIAFGMHLQSQHGNTIDAIRNDNFGYIDEVGGMPESDNIFDIAQGLWRVGKAICQVLAF